MKKILLILFALLLVVGCAQSDKVSGPLVAVLIQKRVYVDHITYWVRSSKGDHTINRMWFQSSIDDIWNVTVGDTINLVGANR